MKQVDGWWWPDGERHMIEWMAEKKNRMTLNGRSVYQGRKQELLLSHCTGPRRVFVDAGAHVGLWAFNFAHWFEKVEAFEPVPEHRECWEKNMQATPDGHTARLWPCALGEKAGMVSIAVDPSSTGGSHVKGLGKVEMRTLDSFDLQDVDAFKLDAEGYEEFILRGAEDTIRRCKPVICVEQKRDWPLKYGLKPQGAITFLKKLGYETVGEISGDYIMRHL